MSIFSIFNLQPRATAPTTPPSQATPAPTQASPVAPSQTSPSHRTSFSLWAAIGHVWQSYGNNVDDPHTGLGFRFRASAVPYYFSPRVGLEYAALCGNYQSVSRDLGEGATSSAEVGGAGWCPELRVHPNSWLSFSGGLYLGLQHTFAAAPRDGRGGLVYANNPVGLSVNQNAPRLGGSLSVFVNPRVGPVDLLFGLRYEVGRTFQSFTPDTENRLPSWPAVPADSTDHFLGFAVGLTFGGNPLRSPRNEENTPPRQSNPGQTAPATAPTTPGSSPTAPVPASAQRSSTPAPTNPIAAPVAFAVATSAPRVANRAAFVRDLNRRLNEAHLADAFEHNLGLSLSMVYTSATEGSIQVNYVRTQNSSSDPQVTYRNPNFPSNMAVTPEAVRHIVDEIIRAGLPRFTGRPLPSSQHPLHITLNRGSDGHLNVVLIS